MAEAPKVVHPQVRTGYQPVFLEKSKIKTTASRLALLRANFGISEELVEEMTANEFNSWYTKLGWLLNQVEDGFSRYDICKELYGMSYQQVVALHPEEFLPMIRPVETVWRKKRKEMRDAMPDEKSSENNDGRDILKYSEHFDGDGCRIDRTQEPTYERDGQPMRQSVIEFAQDFFDLSGEEVVALPAKRFEALRSVERLFSDVPIKTLRLLCAEGFGESLGEMCTSSERIGVVLPKFVREYAIRKYEPEDVEFEARYRTWELLGEAIVDKYGADAWITD